MLATRRTGDLAFLFLALLPLACSGVGDPDFASFSGCRIEHESSGATCGQGNYWVSYCAIPALAPNVAEPCFSTTKTSPAETWCCKASK